MTGLLFLFVTSEVYSQIASDLVFAMVHAKYQQLEVLYGTVGSMATFNLWVSLANTKLQEGSPFLPQLQHMLDARNTLGENGMAISDMQMSFILLDALPPSYSTIAGTILVAGLLSALSPQDLINRFINEESCISSPGAALNKAAPFKSSHMQSNPPRASSMPQKALSSSTLKDVTCYYCNKAGYKSPDCHKKKKDLENVKKGKAGQQHKAAQNTAIADNTLDAQTLARLANMPPIGKSTLQSCNLYTTINGSGKIKEVLDAPQVSLYTMSGNTQKPVAWMMDSRASQHFTPYIEDFTTYTQHRGVEISLGDNSIIKSTGVGSVTIRTNRGYNLILSDVLHVPQTHLHILSTSALTLKGTTVGFDHTGFAIRHSERTIVDGHQNGSLYWLVGHQVLNAASSTASASLDVWHQHMGHMSKEALKRYAHEAVKGLNITESPVEDGPCHSCELGKSTCLPFPPSSKHAQDHLEIVHSDLVSPMQSNSMQGNKYFTMFLDDFSK